MSRQQNDQVVTEPELDVSPVPQNVDPPADSPEPETAHFKRGEKQIHEIAGEVMRGEWGRGQERRLRLAQAGHDHVAVQKAVVKRANGIR